MQRDLLGGGGKSNGFDPIPPAQGKVVRLAPSFHHGKEYVAIHELAWRRANLVSASSVGALAATLDPGHS